MVGKGVSLLVWWLCPNSPAITRRRLRLTGNIASRVSSTWSERRRRKRKGSIMSLSLP